MGVLNMVEIYRAGKENHDQVMALRYEMLQVVNNLESDIFDENFRNATEEYFYNGDQTTFLAIENGIAIGCATVCYIMIMPTYSHPTGKRAHIMNVYVRAEYRNKGIAKELMGEIIKDAKEKGVTHVSLDATELGRPLYASMGFKSTQEGMELILKPNN